MMNSPVQHGGDRMLFLKDDLNLALFRVLMPGSKCRLFGEDRQSI